jgi:hypothetical protein
MLRSSKRPMPTSRRSQPPLARSVSLARFTSRVGGGSAFFVRPHDTMCDFTPPAVSARAWGVTSSESGPPAGVVSKGN